MDKKAVPVTTSLPNKPRAAQSLPSTSIKVWGKDFHYRALFEQSDDCIFIISLSLRYMAANPQACRLLGYKESELVDKPVMRSRRLARRPYRRKTRTWWNGCCGKRRQPGTGGDQHFHYL